LTVPSLEIVSPKPYAKFSYAPPGVDISMEVAVEGVTVAPGQYSLKFYLDGAVVATSFATGVTMISGVPMGQRHLAVRVVDPSGVELPDLWALAGVYVQVEAACTNGGQCDDGLACSSSACLGNTCEYQAVTAKLPSGAPGVCCDQALECPNAWLCDPAEHLCKECKASADCDDADACTADTCDSLNGSCKHAKAYLPNGDPVCCESSEDCVSTSPCQARLCYQSGFTGLAKCVYGPWTIGCCTSDSDCFDGNLCTVDECQMAPADPTGTCHFGPDPLNPECCTTHADCDDADPASVDSCGTNACTHTPDLLYCKLPPTDPVVFNEIMLAPGPWVDDGAGEWIELFNTSQGTIVNLAGYTIALDTGAEHQIAPGPAGLKLFPGAYLVLAREGKKALNGGFSASYVYGDDLPLSDLFSMEGGAVVSTLTLRDPGGASVDQAVIDPTQVLEGRSLELSNPHADNAVPGSWQPAGGHLNPALNESYGPFEVWGSPQHPNRSSEAPLLHPGCLPPIGSHPCSEGRCSSGSRCVFPLEAECCTSDADCNDFRSCTQDACDVAVQKCLDSVGAPGCCDFHGQCDDLNPCNLDRCIDSLCRYSDNLIAGCCASAAECDDADGCTLDSCNLALHTCNPSSPVTLPTGETCCNVPSDCDDGNSATLDQCAPEKKVCIHVTEPDYCDTPSAACSDGEFCTTDTCDIGTKKCQHILKAGCCDANSDCPDSNPCTLDKCDVWTGACLHIPKQGCCTSDAQCDDSKPCTENRCSPGSSCYFPPITGCCTGDADCEDGAACSANSCLETQCVSEAVPGCCTVAGDEATLTKECGDDPDGPASCYVWSCIGSGTCELVTNPVCCSEDTDCDDGNLCTDDRCESPSCVHVGKQVEGTCCVTTQDCPDLDGQACTVPYCADHLCVELPAVGCEPALSGTLLGCEGALGSGGGEAPAGSCWRIDHAGYLGPDAHCECFGFAGSIGNASVLALKAFATGDNSQLTFSARLAWSSPGGGGAGGGMEDGDSVCSELPGPGDLLIQEILADPQSANDANQDGVSDAFDQFLEVVNTSPRELDLSGVAMELNGGTLYTLPPGTCIYPGQGLVLFGSVPAGASYTGALAFAVGEPLGLPATGATVGIRSASGEVLQEVTYGTGAGDGQSIALPDLDPLGSWVKHSLDPYADKATHSAGACHNGARLPYCLPVIPGQHTLRVLGAGAPGNFGSAEVVTTLSVDTATDLASKLIHVEIPTAVLAQQAVYMGLVLESADPPHLDFAVDEVFVAAGHAPFFVAATKLSKTYQAGTPDELTDAGTLTVAPGHSELRLMWAHDADLPSQPLAFSLVGAPSFVSVAQVEELGDVAVVQLSLQIAVPMTEVPGVHDFVVRVHDGVFYQEVPYTVAVALAPGYLVWDPLGGSVHGDHIGAALEANGAAYYRLSDLAVVGSWDLVEGVFATLGGGATTHPVTESEAGPLIAFMQQGGHVYLEGSAAFAEDPATSLLSRFQMVTTAVDAGLAAGLEGRFFLDGLSGPYTADAALLGDVDSVAASLGAKAAKVVLRDSGGSRPGVAVAHEDPVTGSRTVGSTVLLGGLAGGGTSMTDLIGRVIGFFHNGFGTCGSDSQCDDSLACTLDYCVGGLCENTAVQCGSCLKDKDCPLGEVCQPGGFCGIPTTSVIAGPHPPAPFGCDSTDATLTQTLTTPGFGTIHDAKLNVQLAAASGQGVGPLRLTLSHNGVTVVLKEAGPPDQTPTLDVTYGGLGTQVAQGSMQDFKGSFVLGPWVLVVEDPLQTVGCHTIGGWQVWLKATPPVTCTTAANCDNQQFCDGVEACSALGSCSLGAAPDCGDTNPCSADPCDPLRNGAEGACDNTHRAPSCAPAACSGSHAMDAGDQLCGLTEACVGGLAGGVGTCAEVCPGCLAKYGEGLDFGIPNAGCVKAAFDIQATQAYVDLLHVQLLVAHPDLGQLTARLYAPGGASVLVMGGQGAGLVDMASTFERSNPSSAEQLCALYGEAPDGVWTLELCDSMAGQQGVLETASLWVGTTDTDPRIGDHCSNAVPVPIDLGPQSLTGHTKCRSDSAHGICGGAGGRDAVYSFVIPGPASKRLAASLTPVDPGGLVPSWDAVLYVTATCPSGAGECSDLAGVGGVESLDVGLAPGTWYLVVDGVDAGAWGAYSLDLAFSGLANGSSCKLNDDCESAHCQNGYCCASGDCCVAAGNCPASYGGAAVCDTVPTCQGHLPSPSCSASYECGTASVPDDSGCTASLQASNCGLYPSVNCNGAAVQSAPACPTGCTITANCDPGAWCNGGFCVPTEQNGSACVAAEECQSGLCVDGVCCNAACGGTCASCAIAGSLGTCTPYKALTDPANECFGTGTCGGVCNGAGACSFTASTVACAPCTKCDGAGSCLVPTAAGTDPLNDCGLCQACNGAGGCQNVAGGSDPLGECSVDPVASCGKDGACNGAGACALHPNGTVCQAQTCTAGTLHLTDTCNGAGLCVNSGTQSCEGAICQVSGSACSTFCQSDNDCMANYYCHPDGACRTMKPDQMFTDITQAAGLINLDDDMGVAWGDYDNDGYPDVYIGGNASKLYHNNKNGTFTYANMTDEDRPHFADIDNDGDLDFSNSWTQTFAFRVNNGPGGLGAFTERHDWSMQNSGCHAWFDYERDGDLDMWLVDGVPNGDRIYVNHGNLTFTAMLPPSMGELTSGDGDNLLAADYDADGDTDLVYRIQGSARIIRNNGDGTFSEVASHGVPDTQGTNGGGFADYDRDGDLDLFLASEGGPNRLLRNSGNGPGSSFVDVASAAGVGSTFAKARGVAWGDYNNDGHIDLYITYEYAPNELYWNRGDGTFTNLAAAYLLNASKSDRAAMWVDFDLDGDLDLYVGGRNYTRLYRNNLNDPAKSNDLHSLKVEVQGRGRPGDSPVDGTGSRIELYNADGSTLLATRELFSSEGMCSSGPGIAHFGLRKVGGGSGTYQVKVKFTGGKVATRTGVVPVNESITIGGTLLPRTVLVIEPPANLDHMRVSHTDGEAQVGQTEVLTLLSEDMTGAPTETALPVTVTVDGSATFKATDLVGAIGIGTNTLTGMLSAHGTASVTLTDSVQEVVTVAADATGDQELLPNLPSKVAFRPAATIRSFSDAVDATIEGDSPTTWYGSTNTLDVDFPAPVRFLIKFPSVFGVGQVPLGSVIDSATLSLFVSNAGKEPYVREVLESWDGTKVTWNNRSVGVTWKSAGAGDYPSIAPWTLGKFPSATTGLKSMLVTTSVQHWSNGVVPNQGWAFVPSGSSGTEFDSSETGNYPQLTVGYLPPDRDHVVATAADGRALPATTETVTLQLAHLRGAAVAGGLPVTVTVTGSAWFVSNTLGVAASGPGVKTLVGTLAANGSGSVVIQSNARETVTVSADATGDDEVKPNLPALVEFTEVVLHTLRQGDGAGSASECNDTMLDQSNPIQIFGAELDLQVEADVGAVERALIQFPGLFANLAPAVPPTDVILGATLTVWTTDTTDASAEVSLYQLTDSWVETQATWNKAAGGAWSTAGAGTSSHKATACGKVPLDKLGSSSADVTSCVVAWQAGAFNYGWVIESTSTNAAAVESSEHGDPAVRPLLSVSSVAPAADHMVVTATDGYAALAEEEVLSLQLSHRLGAPVPGALPVTVTVVGPGAITATSPVGTLTAAGSGTVTVRCDAPGWVTVTANATGDAEQAPNLSAKLGCRAFRDVTAAAGLGGAGNYAVAWGDYNGDAFPDVYVGGVSPAQGKLYKNPGSAPGAFTAIAVTGGSEGAHWADWDNDGDADLIANADGQVNRNDGVLGFTHPAIGLSSISNLHDVAWLDHDRDGDLDLFTPNGTTSGNFLFSNGGSGTFTKTFPPGLTAVSGLGSGTCAVADYDGDSATDILLRNTDRAYLLRNRNSNDKSFILAAAFSIAGSPSGGNGSAFGDYDNDGDLDLMLGGNGDDRLLRNDGGDIFVDVTAQAGLANVHGWTTAVAWGDFDNDGDLDLYLDVAGASNRLYSNNGDGTFEEVGGLHGVASLSTKPQSGAMFADSDLDGDLDLLVAAEDGSVLLQNTTNGPHHLKVQVRGYGPPLSPIDGTGSRIEIWNSARTSLLAMRELSGGEGYGGHAPRMAHFGLANLGGGTAAYDVRVRFSSGSEVWVDNLVPTAPATKIVIGPTTVPQTIEVVEPAPVADHVTVTATLGAAEVGGTEVLTLQAVTYGGRPHKANLDVTVTLTGTLTGNAKVSATSLPNGIVGGSTVSGKLSADGTATVTITDTVLETVTVSADAPSDVQAAANLPATVVFAKLASFKEGDPKGPYSESDETFIDGTLPTTNKAIETLVRMDASPDQHGLLKFPNFLGFEASQVPPGSSIAKAVLVLNIENASVSFPHVYQVTQSWNHTETTWNQRQASLPWADVGGDGPTSHKAVLEGYLPSATGFQSVVVTGSVQRWSSGEPNQGWILTGAGDDEARFCSSEYVTKGNRPELRVYYTTPP
jgi:subtilisin-like proprotein convertase family protein